MALSNTDLVTELYIGYYNRAPDPAGLQFWLTALNNGQTLTQVADLFATSSESTAIYPYLSLPGVVSPDSFVTQVYNNILNRAPDADGLTFWTDQLNSGKTTAGSFIATLEASVNMQSGTADALTLANKVTVGEYYVNQVASHNVPFSQDSAHAALAPVTSDAATVVAGDAIVDAYVVAPHGGPTQYLTTGIDTFTGTAGADTFDASTGAAGAATFTALDKLDGGDGTDTLNIVQTAAFADVPSASVKNIEIANITSAADVNVNTTTWTGLTSLSVNSSALAGETITAATTTSVTVANTTAVGVTVIGGGGTASVTDGAGAIKIGNTAGGAANANAFTSVSTNGGTTVAVTDNSGAAGVVGATLTTVSVDGNAGAATLTGKGIVNVTVANGVAGSDVTIANATAGHTQNLTVNNDATGLVITDATATTVNINATGKASAVAIAAADATALNVAGTVALTLDTTGAVYTALKAVTLNGSGDVTADLSGATALTAVNASASTGANTVVLDATHATYAGGSGVDTVTISDAPTVAISGGDGSADKLVVNIAGPFNASADAQISGFETLALGAAATGTYDATGFSHLAVDNAITADSTFINVAAGADLTFTASSTAVETIALANSLGSTDSLSIAMNAATGLSNSVVATGVETLNLSGTQTGTGTTAITHSLTVSDVDATVINVSTGALTGFTLVDTDSTKLVTVDAHGVQGDGLGTADTGFHFVTGALAATTTTTMTTITGSANGGDHIDASAALDLITITETAGTNTLIGSSANHNIITGGAGADTITGGALSDTITGGGGADHITAGAGADIINLSGNTAHIVQVMGDSGVNTATTVQTSELTGTFDVVHGGTAGITIDVGNTVIDTAHLTFNAANLAAGADNTAVFASGTYDAGAGTFSYAANGADTAVTYDSDAGAGTHFETVILVGQHVATTTTAASGIITLA